jgi:hypothetical protein
VKSKLRKQKDWGMAQDGTAQALPGVNPQYCQKKKVAFCFLKQYWGLNSGLYV